MTTAKTPSRVWLNPNRLSIYDFSQVCPDGFHGLSDGIPKNFAPYVPASLLAEAERKLGIAREALEGFKLGHQHEDGWEHIRRYGDTYGWCDFCQEKVMFGPGDAEIALAEMYK